MLRYRYGFPYGRLDPVLGSTAGIGRCDIYSSI
eukprot:SAG31_NODE_38024_length_299_cov_1.275000_1_plen_32_part_01